MRSNGETEECHCGPESCATHEKHIPAEAAPFGTAPAWAADAVAREPVAGGPPELLSPTVRGLGRRGLLVVVVPLLLLPSAVARMKPLYLNPEPMYFGWLAARCLGAGSSGSAGSQLFW